MVSSARRRLFTALMGLPIGCNIYLALPWLHPTGEDCAAFLMSARALRLGLNPYELHPALGSRVVISPNLNPPFSLLLFAPFAPLDDRAAYAVLVAASVLAYGVVLAVLKPPSIPRGLWACALAGLALTTATGQIYLLLCLPVAATWLLMERRRYVLAGICLGLLVAVKPPFALWPAALLLAGYALPALAAAGCVAVLWAVPLIVFGPAVYSQWFRAMAVFTPATAIVPGNPSFVGLAGRLGMPSVGLPLACVSLAVLLLWAWKVKPPVEDVSLSALAVGILASPVSWLGYTLWLVPGLLRREWSRPMAIGAWVLCVPLLIPVLLFSPHPTLANAVSAIYTLALLLIGLGPAATPSSVPVIASHTTAAQPGHSSF